MHNTLARWGKLEMNLGKKSEVRSQLQLFTDEKKEEHFLPLTSDSLLSLWNQSFIIEGYENKKAADAARTKGEKIMQHFFDWWSSLQREVIAIEKGFRIEMANEQWPMNNTITGRFDRIEKTDSGMRIIDYKTSAVRSQEEVDADLQLSIYALACQEMFHEPCTELSLLFLHEDGVTEVATQRSNDQLAGARKQIANLSTSIHDGDFAPTPDKNVCGRCPYKGICDAALL